MITPRLLIRALTHTSKSLSKNSTRALSTSNQLINNEINDSTGIATISFNRPPMSSFTLELLEEFLKALDETNKNEECKGIILTSVRKF
jgi:enoyl-CoA hydratase/carnithine racemase